MWPWIQAAPSRLAIGCVRFYQMGISPLLPNKCRFQPTCSQYYILAVQKYGLLKGSWKGLLRICKCHPWGPHGEDPP